MEIVKTAELMQKRAEAVRLAGHVIALVPTMGFFHEGHLELMRVGKKKSDMLFISIFVNPSQFGPAEDFAQYPKDIEGDLAKARELGVDIVFMPSAEEMYPNGFQTNIHVKKMTQRLCGISRPGHFDGVTTVVNKLFNITKPHLAVFGQKDYQQLAVINRMVKDLNMDIKLTEVPIVRESDGLAMSSRNSYLSPEERKSALCLKESLDLAAVLFQKGEREAIVIIGAIKLLIQGYAHTHVEYINLCDPVTLEDIHTLGKETLLALAVKVGQTRLIDNCLLRKTFR